MAQGTIYDPERPRAKFVGPELARVQFTNPNSPIYGPEQPRAYGLERSKPQMLASGHNVCFETLVMGNRVWEFPALQATNIFCQFSKYVKT